jgi:phosphatidylglycerol:prolipoprotein diacylglycerol transferase
MYPVLIKIGSFEIHSWGVAFAISILVGIWIAQKRAPRFGVEPNNIMDLAVVIIISAILGSRLWYVIYHTDEFKGHWIDTINPFQNGYIGIAGLSMVGGVVLAILSSLVYVLVKKSSFTTLGDAIAPSFLLGVGIQRLGGCFLNGCCFGRPTDSFLGVVFPMRSVAGSIFPGQPLWPAQLFASALGFAGFALILLLGRRYHFSGSTLLLVFAYYSVGRFIVDQFRYYEPPQILGQIGPLTINVNHVLLGLLFILCVVLWFRGWTRQRRELG